MLSPRKRERLLPKRQRLRSFRVRTSLNEVNGFISPNSLKEYAQQIVSLMEHPEILVRVGNKASKTISRSWENVIEEVVLRYRDIQESYKLKHGIVKP